MNFQVLKNKLINHPLLFLWPSSLCKTFVFTPWLFHADRRLGIFLGFVEGLFSSSITQNLKQQQGPHKNLLFDCPSSCWVLLWKVTGFSHGSAFIFKTPDYAGGNRSIGNIVLFCKGCRPKSPPCILTLFGKPMMLRGNGFIKVFTPMKATAWSRWYWWAAVSWRMSVFTFN